MKPDTHQSSESEQRSDAGEAASMAGPVLFAWADGTTEVLGFELLCTHEIEEEGEEFFVDIRAGGEDSEPRVIIAERTQAEAERRADAWLRDQVDKVFPRPETRDERQARVAAWCLAAFGHAQSASVPQRGLRLAEEAIETAQAAGCEREMLHRLVDHIYDRPVGELGQELGGVGVTAHALAAAAGLSAEQCEVAEIERVLAKPLEFFAARNAAKNAAGFDVSPAAPSHLLSREGD